MSILKPRTTSVALFHGDDLEHLADLHRELRVAKAHAEDAAERAEAAEGAPTAPSRGGDDVDSSPADLRAALSARDAAQTAYDTAVDEASERAVEVRLQAIGSTRFSDLLLAHPARSTLGEDGKPEIHEDDLAFARAQEVVGYRPVLVDVSTFGKPLLSYRESGRQTVVSVNGEDLSEDDLAEFFDDCAEGDVEQMWTAAFYLNRGMADPKGTTS